MPLTKNRKQHWIRYYQKKILKEEIYCARMTRGGNLVCQLGLNGTIVLSLCCEFPPWESNSDPDSVSDSLRIGLHWAPSPPVQLLVVPLQRGVFGTAQHLRVWIVSESCVFESGQSWIISPSCSFLMGLWDQGEDLVAPSLTKRDFQEWSSPIFSFNRSLNCAVLVHQLQTLIWHCCVV